jgi:soluble lytic murein transglycosylase
MKYVVFDKRLTNLQESFYVLKDNKTLDPDLLFLLGINAVNNQDIEIAKTFFTNSLNKSYYRTDRDKALFWLYLVSKDNKFLDEISKSWDNSIYVLYAKELLGKEY